MPSRFRNAWPLIPSLLYCAAMVAVGIHKGGDLQLHLPLSDLWLRGLPIYVTGPRVGTWWPPFALVAIAPFAVLSRASLALAKAAFSIGSLSCVAWSVLRMRAERWGPIIPGILAVLVPLQANFEDLNLNAPLLGLLVLATSDLAGRREARAGLCVGIMAALKVYPGLLLIYLAWTKRWQALGVGLVTAVGFTLGPLLVYGPRGAVATLARWLDVSSGGVTALHGRSQSLTAVVAGFGASSVATGLFAIVCTAAIFAMLYRSPAGEELRADLATVTLLALLLTPLAHAHYYLLALPAWLVVLKAELTERIGSPWRFALLGAAILTSGILTVWSSGLRHFLWDHSIYAWGGLLLLICLLLGRTSRDSVGPAS